MKFFRYIQKIENRFHSFWVNRFLNPFDKSLMNYWKWVSSMPAIKNSNNNIFDYFLGSLNFLLFIITCLCIPLMGLAVGVLPILFPIVFLSDLGFDIRIAIIIGGPLGFCFARRYIFNDWGK